jgi:cyclic pyranopterin phosphate synthase
MPNRSPFSHLDAAGDARMVDVQGKRVTQRRAVARARVVFPRGLLARVLKLGVKKGSVTGVARIAGLAAAKRTWDLIPLCHAVPLTHISIDFEVCGATSLDVTCAAEAEAKTGVEMEALVGASVAALTLYDMCKALSHGIRIREVALLEKSGGRSGPWSAGQRPSSGSRSR